MAHWPTFPRICMIILATGLNLPQGRSDDFFLKQVAPILEHRCLHCHNSDDRKGEFSLQTRDALTGSGVLVPGQPESSRFLEVLQSASDTVRPEMPADGEPLRDSEVAILRHWIDSGAAWPNGHILSAPVVDDFDWWSLRPLAPHLPPEFPDSEAAAWIRTPVDAFILKTLREKGLTPSREADRQTLIRRLTFDLTGLPPTPEEVQEFISDPSPSAWEMLVDRLLSSPRYGERWARHWLDVVRYADTCGYDKDKLRPNAWPYRDWVIDSLNADKPWHRFVQEQIAGDVLFPGEPSGILGLGFIAAGPWDFIGHVEVPESKIDGMVARNLDRDDMVTGTLNTFCSVTIQCARCHNHKFDPLTQEHYYGLQSVFAAVDRAERVYDTDPTTEARRSELTSRVQSLRDELRALDQEIRTAGGQPLQQLEQRLTELKSKADLVTKPPEFGYHSAIETTADRTKWVEVDLGQDTAIDRIVLHACHDEFGGIGAGFGFPTRFRIEAASTAESGSNQLRPQQLLDRTQEDRPNPALDPVLVPAQATVRYVRVTATRLAPRSGDFIFALAELEILDSSGRNLAAGASVSALDSIEAPVRWRKSNLTDGLYAQPQFPEDMREYTARNQERRHLLQSLENSDRMTRRATLTSKLEEAEKERNDLPTGRLVYAAASEFSPQGNFKPTHGIPRPVRRLHRGNETQPREPAVPGTIPLSPDDTWQFSLPATHSEGDRRAALARWLTRPNHPLTWRSAVNRVWQYHFGRGIVDSPNDFGRMGQQPSHPELLDWLSLEFQRNGQSLKALHRLIVLSSVYRQTTESRPEAEQVDSDNQFLWRMNRRRLEAEEIRDAILAVSGRMNYKMGGPGFYLFELEKPEHSPHYEYHKFNPDDPESHRRSVYRFIVRSQPDPFMTTLDCADSSQSTPRRHETLTALQALSMLNNRFSLNMARHFAARLESESAVQSQQIRRAFELLTGRPPDATELDSMKDFTIRHGLPALARLLFNLNEFVFVD